MKLIISCHLSIWRHPRRMDLCDLMNLVLVFAFDVLLFSGCNCKLSQPVNLMIATDWNSQLVNWIRTLTISFSYPTTLFLLPYILACIVGLQRITCNHLIICFPHTFRLAWWQTSRERITTKSTNKLILLFSQIILLLVRVFFYSFR